MITKNTQNSKNAQATPVIKKSHSKIEELVKSNFLGIGLTDSSRDKILEYISKILKTSRKNIYIVTPNPEIFMLSLKNSGLKNAIINANLALVDGVGLQIAGKALGVPLKNRVIGTNLMERLCELAADWPITVGFLGGKPGVAEKTAECLQRKYPGLKVSFAAQEWDDSQPQKKIDILFIAFGAPKQEIWMAEHINKVPVQVMLGIGGAFDQIVHPSLRPPTFIATIGLGWLYRLVRQPWRLKRQIALLRFALFILKTKLSGNY